MNTAKRMTTILVVCLLMISPAAMAEQAVVRSQTDGAAQAKLYALPEEDAQLVGAYYTGTSVQVQEKGDDWTRITIGGVEGYMRTDALSMDEQDTVLSHTPLLWTRNAGDGAMVSLHERPSEASSELGKFRTSALEMLGSVTDPITQELWYHVNVHGQIGYMRAIHLSVVPIADATSSATVTAATLATPEVGQMVCLMESLRPGGEGGFPKGYYFSGTPVQIIDEVVFSDITWTMVRVDWFTTGFVNKECLVLGDADADVLNDMAQVVVADRKTGERVRLHVRPMESAPALGNYAAGTGAELIGLCSDGNWAHVEIEGQRGYVKVAALYLPGA